MSITRQAVKKRGMSYRLFFYSLFLVIFPGYIIAQAPGFEGPPPLTMNIGDDADTLIFVAHSPLDSIVTISADLTGISGVTEYQNIPGSDAWLRLIFEALPSNKGENIITITFTDNAAEPNTTTLDYSFTVTSSLGVALSESDTVCEGSSGTLYISAYGGLAPYTVYYHLNGTLESGTTLNDTLTLSLDYDASITLDSVVDGQGDKTIITGSTAQVVLIPSFTPALEAGRSSFVPGECSGSYTHPPIGLGTAEAYEAYAWFYLVDESYYTPVSTTSRYNAEEPGRYKVRVTNSFGCQGSDSIDLTLDAPVNLGSANGLICNGNFENNTTLKIPFQSIFKDSVVTCGENQVEGSAVNTGFYGFEFNTPCSYANYFGEGVPGTFTINDTLYFKTNEGQRQVLYPLLPDTVVEAYGGEGDVLFIKGRTGNGCDDGSIPEWSQDVTLKPNTNYLLTFFVASMGDTGVNEVTPPVVNFGIKGDVFIPLIGNTTYLNEDPVTATMYSIDTVTTVKEHVFGDSIMYEYIFETNVIESPVDVTDGLRLTRARKNGGAVWYKVSCRFSSRSLVNTTLSIRNLGIGQEYNIMALDKISLIESNRLPDGGGYRRILAKEETDVVFWTGEPDLLDTLRSLNINYEAKENFTHTLKSKAQHTIFNTYTWHPMAPDWQHIKVDASDGKGSAQLTYSIQACWDYDLTVENITISKKDNLYAGSDTIDISCRIANRYQNELTKEDTKVPTGFRIDLEKSNGEFVYNVLSAAVDIMEAGETMEISTSTVFPLESLETGGEYRLAFRVDGEQLVPCENSEGNNNQYQAVSFTHLFTDLALQDLSMSTYEMLPGVTELNYSFDLTNKGTIPRSILTDQSVTVKVYIAGDGGQRKQLSSQSVLVPRAGRTESFTDQTLILPNDLFVSDSYTLQIVANEDEEVRAETNPSNNILIIPLEVLEHIEFNGINSTYTYPATDPLEIAFTVADNNVGVNVDVTFVQPSGYLLGRGAEFTTDGPGNTVNCKFRWLPTADDITTHTFTIRAEDELGHVAERDVTLVITDTPPVIDSVGPHPDTIAVMVPFTMGLRATDRTVGDSVYFTLGGLAAEEFDPRVVQLTYGTTARAEFRWTPDFSAGGTYRTTIYAWDRGGLKDSTIFDLVVKDLPNSTFNYISDCDTNLVVFNAAGDGAVYTWSFGDGTTITTTNRQVKHTYIEPGKYQVTLTAKAEGVQHSTSKYVTVGSPQAFFATKDVCVGEVSTFSNVTEGGLSYEWDFGDGEESYDINPVHKYQSDKDTTYTCSLTVAVGGCLSTYSQPVQVSEGVVAVISSSDGGSMVCEGTEITFDASSSKGAITYLWNFDDTAAHLKNRSREANISHVFSYGGSYKVQLTVTNGRCRDEEVHYVTVEPRPQLSIEGPEYFCEGSSVVLTGRVNNASQSNFFDYRWLNEVDSTIGFNRTILAGEEGIYKLIIANSCGTSDTAEFNLIPLTSPMAEVSLVSGITCNNASDGQAEVAITPHDTAGAPYTLKWSGYELVTSDTVIALSQLKKGRNYITIENTIGCLSTVSVDIPDNGPSMETTTTPSGCDVDMGVIGVTITGGQTPFTLNWDGPLTDSIGGVTQTAFDLTDLAKGRYKLTVTDDNGCEMIARNLVISSPAISIDVPVEESCGDDSVHIEVTASISNTGTSDHNPPDFEYSWFIYDTASKVFNPTSEISGYEAELEAGRYMVHVNESNYGCLDSAIFGVSRGVGLLASIEGESPMCYGDSSGSLKVNISGNEGTVSYKWTTWDDTTGLAYGPRFKDVPAGKYMAYVSDKRGCSAWDTLTVSQPEKIIVDNFVGNICSATVTVKPENSYTFSWIRLDSLNGKQIENTVQTTLDTMAIGLSQGEYYVQARNIDGCIGKTSHTGTIAGRTEPRTFGMHIAYKNPDEEPLEEEHEEVDVTQIIEDMKVSITSGVSSCKGNIERNIVDFFDDLCFSGKYLNDAMEVEYAMPYYHYTLYYYDRANNLTRTVPPEGVNLLSDTEIKAIVAYRKGSGGSITENNHDMATSYNYNGLNQLVDQETPDAGESKFIYDHISRLRFSQNAHQEANSLYSYTKYDKLGRIIEVGQSGINNFMKLQERADDPEYPQTEISDLTITKYTTPAPGITYYGNQQRYLNNRVSYTFTDIDGDTLTTADQSRTYYSYDPHGNVEWLIQDIPGIGKNYVKYTYDLISGNVLQVAYNEYRADRFFHKYTYDADNRILAVHTSTNGVVWERDAAYNYFAHGPLRRIELGEDNIQGIDYTYTLQGWLKAINSPLLAEGENPGGDGQSGSAFAADVFGMSLGYYKGDFKRTSEDIPIPIFGYHNFSGARNLYNGNISSWASQTRGNEISGTFNDRMTARVFTYDKLNRIKESRFLHDQSGWKNTELFGTSYTYDKNGNLQTLTRNSDEEAQLLMDNLEYSYKPGTNKLTELKDLATIKDNGLFDDLVGNSENVSHRYTYDSIGNLIEDDGYEMLLGADSTYRLNEVKTQIGWNVYGKIDSVFTLRRPIDSIKYDTLLIKYTYGADGNRIVKDVFTHNRKPENRTTTFYVRDASGNIMGTYKRENYKVEGEENQYKAVFALSEQPIYGSSRLGVRTGEENLDTVIFTPGDNQVVEITTKPDKGKAGMLNWITSVLQKVKLGNDEELCDCKVRNVKFGNGVFASESDAAGFMGYAKNNVTLAEDFSGQVLFYSVVAEDYFGNPNVCLVYDKEGMLMKNSYGIKSSARGKPMVIKAQGEANKYYLVTIGEDHKPYYHVVDMAQVGYGSGYTAGAVTSKNIPMDNATIENYGYHMSVIEDNIQRKSLVYMTRYVEPVTPGLEGRTELVVFDFEPGRAEAPVAEVLTSVSGFDKYGEGELQLSPKGNRLAYYNRKRGIAGFAHQEVELHVFGLGHDRKSIESGDTLSIKGSTAGTAGKASMEFVSEDLLLFTQDGLYLNNETLTERAIWRYRFNNKKLEMLPIPVSGDIRRGVDGEIYIAAKGADNRLYRLKNLLMEKPEADTTAELYGVDTVYTGVAGGLPMQAYRIAPVGQGNYARIVGNKHYELTDHLGNVRAVVSDARLAAFDGGIVSNTANVFSYNNYYPFGMLQPGRNFSSSSYRFGFNGKEMDNEVSGTGNQYDYGFRIYNPRIAKFLSVDPLTKSYPMLTPYQFASNTPIVAIDLDGLEMLDYKSVLTAKTGKVEFSSKDEIHIQLFFNEDYKYFNEDPAYYNSNPRSPWITQSKSFTQKEKVITYNAAKAAEHPAGTHSDFDPQGDPSGATALFIGRTIYNTGYAGNFLEGQNLILAESAFQHARYIVEKEKGLLEKVFNQIEWTKEFKEYQSSIVGEAAEMVNSKITVDDFRADVMNYLVSGEKSSVGADSESVKFKKDYEEYSSWVKLVGKNFINEYKLNQKSKKPNRFWNKVKNVYLMSGQ